MDYAKQDNRIVLTYNCRDFESLHAINPNYSDIFVIYENDNSFKDMIRQEIVKVIANIEAANIPKYFVEANQKKPWLSRHLGRKSIMNASQNH